MSAKGVWYIHQFTICLHPASITHCSLSVGVFSVMYSCSRCGDGLTALSTVSTKHLKTSILSCCVLNSSCCSSDRLAYNLQPFLLFNVSRPIPYSTLRFGRLVGWDMMLYSFFYSITVYKHLVFLKSLGIHDCMHKLIYLCLTCIHFLNSAKVYHIYSKCMRCC